ncbi:MAG: hypothetical protein ACR2RD_09125 [Woeseiaceae bacterium]
MTNLSTITSLRGAFVVPDANFWSRLPSECTDTSIFDAQGDDHERIDLRLVEKIDALLEPKFGDPDNSPDWWRNLDCYGDGIRSVSVNMKVLGPNVLSTLQGFLVGEHEPFCILVQVHEDFCGDADTKIGCVAIFADKVMLSRGIARKLTDGACND